MAEDRSVTLGPGALIGRANTATLYIDDPRVSEAHAMVSLRDHCLKLISLRGRFRHQGKVMHEIQLVPEMRLELAEGVEVVCEEVHLPSSVVGLTIWPGPLQVPLSGTTTIHVKGSDASIRRGYDPTGDLIVWSTGQRWSAKVKGQQRRTLTSGDLISLEHVRIQVVDMPLADLDKGQTRSHLRAGALLKCTAHQVIITPDVGASHVISGIPGRILSSVLRRGNAAQWTQIVSDVWPDDRSIPSSLRRRFDAGLRRLRDSMQVVFPGSDDMLMLDGAGVLILQLGKDDRVEQDDD